MSGGGLGFLGRGELEEGATYRVPFPHYRYSHVYPDHVELDEWGRADDILSRPNGAILGGKYYVPGPGPQHDSTTGNGSHKKRKKKGFSTATASAQDLSGTSSLRLKKLRRKLRQGLGRSLSHVGTDCYMAPEVLCGKSYNKSVDLWGLGCVLFEMMSGSFMWELRNNYRKRGQSPQDNRNEGGAAAAAGLVRAGRGGPRRKEEQGHSPINNETPPNDDSTTSDVDFVSSPNAFFSEKRSFQKGREHQSRREAFSNPQHSTHPQSDEDLAPPLGVRIFSDPEVVKKLISLYDLAGRCPILVGVLKRLLVSDDKKRATAAALLTKNGMWRGNAVFGEVAFKELYDEADCRAAGISMGPLPGGKGGEKKTVVRGREMPGASSADGDSEDETGILSKESWALRPKMNHLHDTQECMGLFVVRPHGTSASKTSSSRAVERRGVRTRLGRTRPGRTRISSAPVTCNGRGGGS